MPGAFLVMVLVQFGMMLVDRALYLRKAVLGKCAFQILLVLGTHLWLFFILPGITMRYLGHLAGSPFSLPSPPTAAPREEKKATDHLLREHLVIPGE